MLKKALFEELLIVGEAATLTDTSKKKRKKSKNKRVDIAGRESAPDSAQTPGPERDINKKNRLSYDAHLSKEEVSAYLKAVAEGLRQGRIKMSHDGKCLELLPNADLRIDISAAQKGPRQRLAFEVSWRLPEDE